MHRRSVLSTFHFFHFFENCEKMIQKTEQNWYPQKTSKNEAPGVPRWSQNGSELIEKILKISKIDSKKSFLRGRFFDDFLVGQKTFPGGYNHPRESLDRSLGSWWGVWGDQQTQPGHSLSHTPLGRWPGELYSFE